MQPKNLKRLLRALERQGLDVSYSDVSRQAASLRDAPRTRLRTYSVRLVNSPDAPVAEVLLPEGFPIEAKALKQLANLASVRHPSGGCVCHACATPDFHPGDAGVAIGSIVETVGQVIPGAVGSDINCGMRLHVVDLTIEEFLAKRDQFVEKMKGDYFFGTPDVTMTAQTMRSLFQYGVPGWLDAMLNQPTGSVVKSDLQQLAQESDRIFLGGSMDGDWKLAPLSRPFRATSDYPWFNGC
ncbi:RtcB family protein [Nostoc sp.]|uniref:RtcB family protein n=1 Tax=Nostoc sp. TaxID=1180 RepID=UPI002FFBD97D